MNLVTCFLCSDPFATLGHHLARTADQLCPRCTGDLARKRGNLARAVELVAEGLRVLRAGRVGVPPLLGLHEELIQERSKNIVAALQGEFMLEPLD